MFRFLCICCVLLGLRYLVVLRVVVCVCELVMLYGVRI